MREEEWRQYQAQRRKEKLEALEQERLVRLVTSGALLRQVEDIRALVVRVKAAVLAGERSIDAEDVAAWEDWANDYVDRIDPVKSGQVLQHIRPPSLREE